VYRVVLDTNVLVSAILASGPPAAVVDLIANGKLWPFYNDDIISEYWEVLYRSKFGFQSLHINRLLDSIVKAGSAIETGRPSKTPMTHEDDRKFYDVAKTSSASLITGNIKHFPKESFIITPSVFLKTYLLS